MTIRVPNTLTADNSEKYEVSIRLWPGGLSFSGCIPSEKDSFFTETALFDDDMLIAQSLKGIFFDNPCFSYVYKSLYVICVSGRYTFVPDNVFLEKEKDRLFLFCHHRNGEEMKVLAQPLKKLSLSLLFDVNADVYEFLMRSLVNPCFIHCLSPLLTAWQKESLVCYPKQVYIFIHEELLDIVCFERGEMLFANSFAYETQNDVIYYIVYVCRQLGINQLEDCLHFCGNKGDCYPIMSEVKKYIGQVDYLLPKMKDYIVAVDQDVYMDVLTLTECGL